MFGEISPRISVVVLLQQCTHGDRDPLVFDVDVNDLYPYNITNGNDVLDIFHTLVSQLRNVDQTVYASMICANAPNGVMETIVASISSPTL